MSFLGRLTATCTIQSVSTSVNTIGEATRSYSTGTEINCRKTAVLTQGEGQGAARVIDVTRDKFFLAGDAIITESHRIQHNSGLFNVIRIDGFPGGTGTIHHYEVITEQVS